MRPEKQRQPLVHREGSSYRECTVYVGETAGGWVGGVGQNQQVSMPKRLPPSISDVSESPTTSMRDLSWWGSFCMV